MNTCICIGPPAKDCPIHGEGNIFMGVDFAFIEQAAAADLAQYLEDMDAIFDELYRSVGIPNLNKNK